MKLKIQNTGKTPAKNKFGKSCQINTVHSALILKTGLLQNLYSSAWFKYADTNFAFFFSLLNVSDPKSV